MTSMRILRRKTNQNTPAKIAEYATRSDFQEIFSEDMAGLHLLAFLLTVDVEKAKQCFVAGLDDSVRGNAVFRQWARAWSKRSIIKNAIKAISPAPGQRGSRSIGDVQTPPSTSHLCTGNDHRWTDHPQGNGWIASVTSLDPFDRFVLVMTVLEGYSLRECSALLAKPVAAVTAAKARALEQMDSLSVDVRTVNLSSSRGSGLVSIGAIRSHGTASGC